VLAATGAHKVSLHRDPLRQDRHPVQLGIRGRGANTVNILLQDACPNEVIDQHQTPHSALALRWTLHALGRPGAGRPGEPAELSLSADLRRGPDDSNAVRAAAAPT
jgi:hypothetical protein